MQLAAVAPLAAQQPRCNATGSFRAALGAAPLRLTRAPRRAPRRVATVPAARSPAIPRGLAFSLDLAARRAAVTHSGHALQTPIEHGEAELFHVCLARVAQPRKPQLAEMARTDRIAFAFFVQAISVATQGPASAVLSAALVEVATILLMTAVAARAVHLAAARLGLAEAARVRGEAAEAAVVDALATATPAAEPAAAEAAISAAAVEADDSLFDAAPHYAPTESAASSSALEHRREAPALLHAYLTRPATTLVWATGGAAALRSVLRAAAAVWNGGEPLALLGVPAETLLGGAWRLALIACTAWGAVVWASEALERAAALNARHAAVYFAARALARRIIAAAAALAALSVVGVPLQALLTFGGVGGVVLGIGARAAASNALAGFFLMLTHTLHEGDAVELVGRGISGVVVDVSLTATTLLSQDATTVSLPNAELAKVPLRNFTRARVAAFIAAFPLPLHRVSAAPAAVAAMERFLAAHPAVAQTAAGGRLRTSVALLGPAATHEAAAVTLQARAYIDARGRSAAEVESVKQSLLVGLADVIEAAAGGLAAPAMPMQLVQAPRPRMRRVPRRRQKAAASDEAASVPQHPHGSEEFSWRGGEIEADADA